MNAAPTPSARAKWFPLILFVGVAVLMSTCFLVSFKSRSGQGLTREDAPFSNLPEDAQDVSYYIPGLLGDSMYLEFRTSEEAFLAWVESQADVPMEKRSEGAFEIGRFSHELGQGQMIAIDNGLLYGWTDGPKGFFMGYDRGTGTAYLHSRAK